jgi:A/G-specific adenine glycosylase
MGKSVKKDIQFADTLLSWHQSHARELPWKKDKDPYKIWISEIILQQTRVAQGLPYYQRFIARFPNLKSLAKATEDELLQVWKGLGYYSRARNLHFTASYIKNELNGHFPDSYRELIRLKGIGPYTAAAIASFAFDEPRAVVDGNVIRVLARVFGIDEAFDKSQGKKAFQQAADDQLATKNPAGYNQAIMDFGATVCTPAQPKCSKCPFTSSCFAFRNNQIQELPIKSKSLVKKKRYFHYFVLIDQNRSVLLRKRKEKDIWKGLYDFPGLEVDSAQFNSKDLPGLPDSISMHTHFIRDEEIKLAENNQILSHQHIFARFQLIPIDNIPLIEAENFYLVDYENLCNFAFPKIIDWFINEYLVSL